MANSGQDGTSDASLIEAVMRGDARRFDEIVRRYEPALSRVARSRLQTHQLAEEAVQETFLWAFKSLHTYDSKYSFRTWLWTILLNRCRRIRLKHHRDPRVVVWSDHVVADAESQSLQQVDPQPLPDEQLQHQEKSDRIEAFLRRLPENQAQALRLRFFAGLKYQVIADTMGCSLSTAKNRVRWGLEKMSRLMREAADDSRRMTHPESTTRALRNGA